MGVAKAVITRRLAPAVTKSWSRMIFRNWRPPSPPGDHSGRNRSEFGILAGLDRTKAIHVKPSPTVRWAIGWNAAASCESVNQARDFVLVATESAAHSRSNVERNVGKLHLRSWRVPRQKPPRSRRGSVAQTARDSLSPERVSGPSFLHDAGIANSSSGRKG